MAFCGNCGQFLSKGVAFCPNCGTAVPGFTPEVQEALNEAKEAVNEAKEAVNEAREAVNEAQETVSETLNDVQETVAEAANETQGAYQQQQQGTYQQQQQDAYQQQQQQQQQQSAYQQYQSAPAVKPVHPVAAGMWAYLFGWIGFIVCIAGADQTNPYVRFHTNQSLVLCLFNLIGILSFVPIVNILVFLWEIFMFVCWIIAIIGASKGEMREIPLLGKIRILK